MACCYFKNFTLKLSTDTFFIFEISIRPLALAIN